MSRKTDASAAQATVEAALPDPTSRTALLKRFAATIAAAHAANPASWEVTLDTSARSVNLNVGAVLAVGLSPRALLLLVDGEVEGAEAFRALPGASLLRLAPGDFGSLERHAAAHLRAVDRAARRWKRTPYHWAHATGAVDYLASATGIDVPQPLYGETPGRAATVDELVAAVEAKFPGWTGFSDPKFVKEEIEYKQSAGERARELLSDVELSRLIEARDFDEIVQRIDKIGKLTNLLFIAVPRDGDLSILYRDGLDREAFCNAFRDLLYGEGDGPDRLGRFRDWAQASGRSHKWAFCTYFPFLCHPDEEIFVKPQTSQSVLRLLGSDLELGSAANGETYGQYRALAQELRGALGAYGPRDMIDIQSFLWVAVDSLDSRSGAADPKLQYWKIAPGEQAVNWEECRDGGYISIGWPELGDVRELTKAQFEAKRDELEKLGGGYTRSGMNQVWRFVQIGVGDRIVANRGMTEVVGIGTVTGPPFYVPGKRWPTRLPVRWDNVESIQVDQPGWVRTLIKLDKKTFEAIASKAIGGAPVPTGDVAVGSFTSETLQLLEGLTRTQTREYYQAHKDRFKVALEEPLQDLLRRVVEKLPAAMRMHLETEKNVFARILKNDWGRGGAWPFYWGALYPKGGKRIEGAQLYVSMNRDSLRLGFSLGQYGGAAEERFLRNWRKAATLLSPDLERALAGSGALYGKTPGIDQEDPRVHEYSTWAADPQQLGVQVRIEIPADDVIRVRREELADRVATVFQSLFPLFVLAALDDPAPALAVLAGEDDETGEHNPPYSITDLAAETHMAPETVATWVRAIERKKQAVLYGPPGTGKTFLAERIAKHLVAGGDGIVEIVQFHPSYGYEDFIQGIRPLSSGNDGIAYRMVAGRFVEFCNRAATRSGNSVLIVDEINRANLSRVFGELMYLLEYRDQTVPLAGGGVLHVPPQVRILGTMNTADRSIALVDHALRRRFAFLHLKPNFAVLEAFHAQRTGLDVAPLIAELKKVNQAIGNPHYEVGISFFLSDKLKADLPDVWRHEIEPYLEEYFFDQPDRVKDFKWEQIQGRVTL